MANTKSVEITGIAPFTIHEHEPLQPMLAFLAGPTTGVRINWTGSAGYIDPNEHGGKTALYCFELTGQEALPWPWIDKFKAEIEAIGGKVETDKCRDIEG